MSDTDDDLALDDEEYHEALLGYREARDLTKRPVLQVHSILLLSPFVQKRLLAEEKVVSSSVKNVSGQTGRGKGGRGSKSSGRPSGLSCARQKEER